MMRISYPAVWAARQATVPTPRFTGLFETDNPSPPPAENEAGEEESRKESPALVFMVRMGTAAMILLTSLIIFTKFQEKQPDFMVPPKIHAPEEPTPPDNPAGENESPDIQGHVSGVE